MKLSPGLCAGLFLLFAQTLTTPAIAEYGYAAREPDASGLVYYRARYYDAALGRFEQRDPLGLDAGINDYAYAAGRPVAARDPSGLAASEPEAEIGPLGRYWDEHLSILHPTPGAPPRPPGEALQALAAGAFFAVNAPAFATTALLANAVYRNFGERGLALLFGPKPDPGGIPLAVGEVLPTPLAHRGTLTSPARAFERGLVAVEGSEFAAAGRLRDMRWRTPVLFASLLEEQAIHFGGYKAMMSGLSEFWVYSFRLPDEAIFMNSYWLEKGLVKRIPSYDLAMQEVLVPYRLDPCLIICAQRGLVGAARLQGRLDNPNYLPP